MNLPTGILTPQDLPLNILFLKPQMDCQWRMGGLGRTSKSPGEIHGLGIRQKDSTWLFIVLILMLRHRWIDHRMKWYILPKMVEFFEWPLQAALWRHKPFLEQSTQDILGLCFISGTENSESLYSLDMVDTTLYYTILQYMPEELFDAFTMLWLPAVVVDSWLIENGRILQRLWFQQCFNSTAGNLPICSTACSKQIVDSKTDDRKVLVPRLYHLNHIRWVFPCRTMRPPLQRVAMLWTLLAWGGKDEIYDNVTWCGMQCLFWKRSLIALQ